MDKTIQKDTNYSDTTRLYLNSLGRVPLMNRGQESEQGILMLFARRRLLDMAFRERLILNMIYRIADQLRDNIIEPIDILRIEENQAKDDPVYVAKICEAFLAGVNEIQALSEDVKKMKDVVGDSSEEAFLQKIQYAEDQYVEKCQQLRLNTRQIGDILGKYKAFLQEKKMSLSMKKFIDIENEWNDAKCSVIEANVRLVVSIAKRYVHRGMEISDLIQEGNKGLITAVDNFDYRKGYKFSTYAIWWIRESISRAIHEKSKTIHLPASTHDLVNKIEQFNRKHQLQYGIHPTIDRIAEELNCSIEKIEFALECAVSPISLDMETGHEEKTTISEYIEDTRSENPFNRLSLDNLREHINMVLNSLDPKERETVIMRFGLDDGRIKTLNEIGAKLKLTNERVRQIEIKALRKLKQSNMAQKLESWREDVGDIAEYEF